MLEMSGYFLSKSNLSGGTGEFGTITCYPHTIKQRNTMLLSYNKLPP